MPSSVKESHVDVLIVGAGPAGLMACNALSQAGIKVKIVDQKPLPVSVGHADGIQPRTLEVLQSYGLVERVLAEGFQLRIATFFEPGANGGIELMDIVPDVRVDISDTNYPYEFLLNQGGIESMFLDSMKTVGVKVDRPVAPTSIHVEDDPAVLQDLKSYPVHVALKSLNAPSDEDNEEIVHAKFVIGADGAHSWVRKALGIVMEGEQSESVWGVVDIVPETDFPYIRTKAIIHSHSGTIKNIPREGDKVRLYVQLGEKEAIDEGTGRVVKDKYGVDDILEVSAKIFYPYTFHRPKVCEWWTIYQVGQRVASSYSKNERVFIAGDACHTHSPKAGQGMNASMNDTHNLAWKLIHVIRGWADMSLLKTYQFERKKYAHDLIDFDKQLAPLFIKDPRDNQKPHEALLQAFITFGGLTTGIGVHYQDSTVVVTNHESHTANIVPGKRVPPQTVVRSADGRPYELQELLPADTRFKLLVFAGDVSIPEQLKSTHKVAAELFTEGRGLWKFVPQGNDLSTVFDILTISKTKLKMMFPVTNELPKVLKSHWTKVFVDDKDILEIHGGNAYNNFGIDPKGVVVVVRPDGYVGTVVPFDRVKDVESYFAAFAKHSS